MQNFDVYLVLMTAALAVYYGLVKPSMEKDKKAGGEKQEAKGDREGVELEIDSVTITFKKTV
jgi:hypothetical protein